MSLIAKEVTVAVPDIHAAMPPYGRDRTLLSFCFVDPFSAELDFDVIRQLGDRYRMDFLVLLMLGRDIRTNFRRYLEDEGDERIARLLDDPGWREEWRESRRPDADLVRFIIEKLDQAMVRLGYESNRVQDAHSIRIPGKGVFLYSLVFYSRHQLARNFFKAALAARVLSSTWICDAGRTRRDPPPCGSVSRSERQRSGPPTAGGI